MARTKRPELEPFHELNSREKATGKKASWGERFELIAKQFPNAVKFDWHEAFRDNDELFGRIIRDIWGEKVPLSKEALDSLRKILGEDYSVSPFRETFIYLVGDRSVRHVATKTGLSATVVHELKHGQRQPDLFTLEQIAAGFNKHPSYFMEYRAWYLMGAMLDHLMQSPETTVDLYKKFKDDHGETTNTKRHRRSQ